MHSFGDLVHIFGELVNIFGKLVHISAGKLVSRTSKQVSRTLGPLWQPGVYNDTKESSLKVTPKEGFLWDVTQESYFQGYFQTPPSYGFGRYGFGFFRAQDGLPRDRCSVGTRHAFFLSF